MSTKTVIQSLVIVGALGAAAFFFFQNSKAPVEDPAIDLTCWICVKEGCNNEFRVPRIEVARIQKNNPDLPPPCPKCGESRVVRGIACPQCGHFLRPVGHGALPEKCVHCGKPTVPGAP